jgi:hypothetical protein
MVYGLQWPMVLILRPFDNNVLSVSRKKVHCHEEMYAKFDPETMTRPMIDFKDFKLDKAEINEAITRARRRGEVAPEPGANLNLNDLNKETEAPPHLTTPNYVLSVKVLSDAKRNNEFNATTISDKFPEPMKLFNSPQHQVPGEIFDIPDPLKPNKDLLLEEIQNFKNKMVKTKLTDSILKALTRVENDCKEPVKKLISSSNDTSGDVDVKNVALTKRTRKAFKKGKSNSTPDKLRKTIKMKVAVRTLKVNDCVKMKTCRFDVVYTRGKQKYTYGTITAIDKGQIADVQWETEENELVSMSAHQF